jgi:hypothetical protein
MMSSALAWVRPDAESVDLNRENVECQFEASKLTVAAGLEGVDAEQRRAELEVLCMEAKGWSVVSQVRLPAPAWLTKRKGLPATIAGWAVVAGVCGLAPAFLHGTGWGL